MNPTIKELNTIIFEIKNKTYLSYCLNETKKLLNNKTFTNLGHFIQVLENTLFVHIYNVNFGVEYGNDLDFIGFLSEGSIINDTIFKSKKKINQKEIIEKLNSLQKDLIKNKIKDHY